ncbi:MAG: hypothetical protein IPN80_02855 [Flavobacterium sp.]|nr:hypothetical protein [Flavobacterium sp.]
MSRPFSTAITGSLTTAAIGLRTLLEALQTSQRLTGNAMSNNFPDRMVP